MEKNYQHSVAITLWYLLAKQMVPHRLDVCIIFRQLSVCAYSASFWKKQGFNHLLQKLPITQEISVVYVFGEKYVR